MWIDLCIYRHSKCMYLLRSVFLTIGKIGRHTVFKFIVVIGVAARSALYLQNKNKTYMNKVPIL